MIFIVLKDKHPMRPLTNTLNITIKVLPKDIVQNETTSNNTNNNSSPN